MNSFQIGMNSFRLIFLYSATASCARQKRQWHCVFALLGYLQPAAKLVTGHWWQGTLGQVALTHADTISIIYTLYAAGACRDCVKWHGDVYRDSRQPHPATPPPPSPMCSIKIWRRQLAAAAGRGSRRRSAMYYWKTAKIEPLIQFPIKCALGWANFLCAHTLYEHMNDFLPLTHYGRWAKPPSKTRNGWFLKNSKTIMSLCGVSHSS